MQEVFKETDNTILFKTRKDLNIWSKYIECMIDKRPLREIEEICNISLQTSLEWRNKILDLLSKMMDDIKLDGIVESDETYTRVSYKGNHTKSLLLNTYSCSINNYITMCTTFVI